MRADTEPVQMSLEEAVPLSEVKFVVVDLETTGGSPSTAGITEIGAVAYRGGERIGTFETFVDPGQPIPPFVARLTGISDRTVAGAPSIGEVLPSFVEFARGAVIVAHNAPFDVGFLDAALDAHDLPLLPSPAVCTAKLARRVVWPDVPNVKLHTLSQYFRTPTQPRHRAFADAQATAEVLHGLLELGGRLGIGTLGELHAAVQARGRPNYGKIRLADDLPRSPGVYLFTDRDGAVLYVGKSKDLRTRVRSYFYGDSRKKVGRLLEQTAGVEGRPCESELEALVVEARLIREHEPSYNRHGKGWRRYTYLKLDLAEAFPRLKVVRDVKGEGVFLGPFSSASRAQLAKEALEDAFPIRRCTRSMGASTRFSPCALAGIGRCPAPCDGRVDADGYRSIVDALRQALESPGGLLAGLEERMRTLAADERFEEAAAARDRLRAIAEAIARGRQDAWLLGGRMTLRDADGRDVLVDGGSLPGATPISAPCPRERADELTTLRNFLSKRPPVVVEAESAPCEPVAGGAEVHRVLAMMRTMGDEPAAGRGRR